MGVGRALVIEGVDGNILTVIVGGVACIGDLDLRQTAGGSHLIRGLSHFGYAGKRQGGYSDDDDDGHQQFGQRESHPVWDPGLVMVFHVVGIGMNDGSGFWIRGAADPPIGDPFKPGDNPLTPERDQVIGTAAAEQEDREMEGAARAWRQ